VIVLQEPPDNIRDISDIRQDKFYLRSKIWSSGTGQRELAVLLINAEECWNTGMWDYWVQKDEIFYENFS
jgi:hypothetical protein